MSERINWTPEQFWEYVEGLAGDFNAGQMRDMLAERGLGLAAPTTPSCGNLIEYTVDAKGSIQIPDGAPFDGNPVLIKLAAGWCEAYWEDARVGQNQDGTTYDGFCWVYMDGEGMADLDDVRLWAPLPDAALSSAPVSAWQDISTAPKDTRSILVFGEKYGVCTAYFGEWHDNLTDEDHEGWLEVGSYDKLPDVTHWQPIPAGPISRNERGVEAQ